MEERKERPMQGTGREPKNGHGIQRTKKNGGIGKKKAKHFIGSIALKN